MKPMKMWAWWDNVQERFVHVYENKLQVNMCFPYGYRVEEDKGKGKLLEVIVMPAEEFLKMRCFEAAY